MSLFEQQAAAQGYRCAWCQGVLLDATATRDHLYPRIRGLRRLFGSNYVVACRRCNMARNTLSIGSLRFNKWLRRVLRGDVRRFIRHDRQQFNGVGCA